MDCQKVKEFAYQYMDGELQDDVNTQVKAHLDACPLCKMQMEKEQNFDDFLRNHMIKEEAPYALREQVVEILNTPRPWQWVFDLKWLRPASMAAAMTVIVGIILFSTFNQPFPVFASSVETHMEHLSGAYPLEIITDDVDEALRWFEGKVKFALERPHLDPSKVRLLGARLVHLQDRKAAYFVFEKNGHRISAILVDVQRNEIPRVKKENIYEGPKSTVYTQQYKGYNSVVCQHKGAGTGCIVVGSMPKEMLMGLMG